MTTTAPPELLLMLADPDPDERAMCTHRRVDRWGHWAHSCTWPAGHSGTRHHDTHTGAIWEDRP